MSGAVDVYRYCELGASTELAVCNEAPKPTDNPMKTPADIARFCDGLAATVILGTNPHLLCDMALVAGPMFWYLCCLAHPEFFRMFHQGVYKGIHADKLDTRLKAAEALRQRFRDFQRHWAYFSFAGPHSRRTQWLNMRGELFSPTPNVPAFEYRCFASADEFCLEYYDGQGRLSRKVRDSKGAIVNPMVGYPCSVLSRDHIVDVDVVWEDDVIFEQEVHSAWFQIKYEPHCVRLPDAWHYETVTLYPDSDAERDNFAACGFKADHPLVRRNYPNLWLDLVCC